MVRVEHIGNNGMRVWLESRTKKELIEIVLQFHIENKIRREEKSWVQFDIENKIRREENE